MAILDHSASQNSVPIHGSLVETYSAGKYLGMIGSSKVTAEHLAAGIEGVTTDESIIAAAQAMSVQVLAEDGTANALSFIDKMVTSFSYPWPIKIES